MFEGGGYRERRFGAAWVDEEKVRFITVNSFGQKPSYQDNK